MGDVALSAVPSPLAALLPGGSSDSSGTAATASQGSDPFAALLASATVIKNANTPAGTKTADAVALLLAGTAPVATAPISPSPIAVSAAAPAIPALPINRDALLLESDGTSTISEGKTRTKAEDDDPDTDSDSKKEGGDPLADAIASGATAVLALVPAIVAPVQAQDVAAMQTSARTDVPIALRSLKLTAAPIGPAGAQAEAQAQVRAQAQTDQAAATQDQMNSDAAQADAGTAQQQQPQQAPGADAEPATTQLSPDAAKAIVAALKQTDVNPVTVAQSAATNEAAKIRLQQQQEQPQQQTAALPAHPHAAPVQADQARRRSEEVAPPRRSGDTRKRGDIILTDAASPALSQPATDAAQPTIARPVTDVHAKGDTIVEQTLTIARDGAWLDKLAHDIASAGGGNELHFKLQPQNLGGLSVAIRQNDDGASIRLTADNQKTRDILVDAQPKLVAEARAHGLKVSDTQIDVRHDQNHSQNQGTNQDAQRWAQQQASQNGTSQNGQNRQSSPGHQPFVSNLAGKTESDSESPDRDSDARYA